MKLVTLKDVAKFVGVHPSVVSRVINNDHNLKVRESTRNRILSAVEELNYQPNQSARNLKMNKTKMLGMVIPDFSNPVYASIIHGAEDQAAAQGYNLLLYSMKQRGLDKNYFSHLLENRIDGLLIANSASDDTEVQNLQQTNKPFVLVNRFINGIEQYVILDDKYGSSLATKHLADLGHTNIAHITGPLYTATGLKRFQGFRESLKEENISFNSNYIQESEYSITSGYDSMEKLLDLPEPPTAVFAASVLISIGAMKAIHDRKLKIPDDISIVGFHDFEFSSALSPALTTVKMPLYKMGQEAVKKLILVVQGDKKDGMRGLKIDGGSLIVRESTKTYSTQ